MFLFMHLGISVVYYILTDSLPFLAAVHLSLNSRTSGGHRYGSKIRSIRSYGGNLAHMVQKKTAGTVRPEATQNGRGKGVKTETS